jgi:iron complex transport system substrate-binding protein
VHRRPRLLTALATAAVAAVALSGCSGTATAQGSDADAAWSYDSGDGQTYTADHVPSRIIAHAYAAKALMEFGITPIAIYADGPITEDVGLQGADFDGIPVIGEEWGKIDVAKAAELEPDLIVGDWWPAEDAYSGFEGGVEEESKKLADLAPVVGPSQGDSVVDLIEGYAGLAVTLGADSQAIDDARAEFDEARKNFEAANDENPGVSALAISPWDDNYAVAVSEYAPELQDFASWGLNVIDPETPDPDFPYWETLSMEKADTYQPDLLLIDDRNAKSGEQILADAPISKSISAYAAGQTTLWPAYWMHTYSDYTAQLNRLADVVRDTDAEVGAL